MPGVGKTELANVIGHALASDYPDVQLFFELEANRPSPLTPERVLTQCLHLFSPDIKLPDDLRSLRNLYLAALQNKRVLVILDDARDDAHIAPLLPPAGCAVIVTSRRALRTGISLSIDVLPRAESIKLLNSLCNRIAEHADTIAALCGDLPMALIIAGGHLKQYKSQPVDEYIKALQGLHRVKRLGNDQIQLEALFDYSYRVLNPLQQAAFKALSVMPDDFGRVAALEVIGDDDSGATSLDELVILNLLQYDENTGRYRWHDLLREFAASCANKHETDAAASRHSVHYVGVLSRAQKLYLQGNDRITLGLSLYDMESTHIQVGQVWATSHTKVNAAAQLCIDYAYASVYILDLHTNPHERIQWLEAALTAAKRLHDRKAEGAHLGNLGNVYRNLGDARKAIALYKQALVIHRKIGDRYGEGAALGGLGLAYARTGDTHKAIEYHNQALVIAREIGDRHSEGRTLGNLGNAYSDLGDARKAIEYYEQSLVIDREFGDRCGEGNALGNLGNLHVAHGSARNAIDFYKQQLRITREIGDRRGEGNALIGMGLAHTQLGDIHKAIEFYEKHRVIAREIGDRRGEGAALGNLGLAYVALGDTSKAVEFYEQALVIFREIGDRRSEASTSWILGDVYAKQGEIVRAAALMQVYVDFLREIGHPDTENRAKDVEELRAKLADKGKG